MMKKIDFKKILGVAALCLGLSSIAVAQCSINASYTYTIGTNGQISFSNTSTVPADTIVSYSWDFGDNTSSTDTNVTHTYAYNGTYNIYLYAYSYHYYTNPDSLNADSSLEISCESNYHQTITISNAAPCSLQANFTYTLGTNGNVSFTNTPIGANSFTQYHWYVQNGGMPYYWDSLNVYDSTTFTHTFINNGTDTIVLQAYNTDGTCSNTYTAVITITSAYNCQNTQASFTYTLGANGEVDFTSTSATLPTNPAYGWDFGDGTGTSLNSTSAITHTFTYNGTYNVTLDVYDAVYTQCWVSTNTVITITSGITPIDSCTPQVNFSMNSLGSGNWQALATYTNVSNAEWIWGDGTFDFGLYPSHIYTTAGMYHICVMGWSACGDSAYACQNDSLYRTTGMISVTVLNVNNVTGIKTNTQANAQILVYPNPSTGAFTFNLSNVTASKAQINITNILGEVVYSSQEQINDNSFSKEINLQNIASGTYFIKAIVGDKAYISKLIKN